MHDDRERKATRRFRVAFQVLGCRTNRADAVGLIEKLPADRFELVEFGEPADAYIIQSCLVTQSAERQSRRGGIKRRGDDHVVHECHHRVHLIGSRRGDDARAHEVADCHGAATRFQSKAGEAFEQDDGENWIEVQRVLRGARAKRQPFNLQMGQGNEKSDDRFPGPLSYVFSEAAARGLYTRWARMMAGDSG